MIQNHPCISPVVKGFYWRQDIREYLQYILDKKADQGVNLDNGKEKLRLLMEEYRSYKRRFAKDIRFDFYSLTNGKYVKD